MGATIYSVGILTISDTSSQDALSDSSGPLLRRSLESHPSDAFRVVTTAIVPDEPVEIAATVKRWIDEIGIRLVFTTGGTGLGVRDCTPEALSTLIDKPTPGITQALISHSLTKTPLAALSRLVTGIRQTPTASSTSKHGSAGGLIISLPGSPKAVKECLEILLGASSPHRDGFLLHALELCTGVGGTKAGQETHQELLQQRDGQLQLKGTETDTGASRYPHHHGGIHVHGRHHHHHHHHHDTGHSHSHAAGIHSHLAPQPRTAYLTHSAHGPSTLRARQSPYPILSLGKALALIDEHTPIATEIVEAPVDEKLVGHVIAEDVQATSDLPPGDTTNVDGYAVDAKNTPPGRYKVVTASLLAERVQGKEQENTRTLLRSGEVCRVNTGQGLPAGTDGIVMVEDTALLSTKKSTSGQEEEDQIEILAQIDSGENVRPSGSDVHAGTTVLVSGTTISALGGEIGTLAFLGKKSVKVFRKPKVALLSTGDELKDLKEDLSKGPNDGTAWGFRVYDSNRPSLKAAIEGMGLEVVDLGILGDNPTQLKDTLRKGAQEADIILTTGGTSMGESDLLKPIIERELGGVIHFGRVAMKPGKPTTFATIPPSKEQDRSTLLFALPGNPASALVCFYIFALPCLRKMLGVAPRFASLPTSQSSFDKEEQQQQQQQQVDPTPEVANPYSLPRIKVKISSDMNLDPRPEFHRVALEPPGMESQDGLLVARSTGAQRSSGMHSMATANGLVCVPALTKGSERKTLKAGEVVDAILLGAL